MAYNDGEALILTRVQALSSFGSTNTSRGDWKILNRGASDHYAILRRGAAAPKWLTIGVYTPTWQTIVEVWQRYTDDGDSQTNVYARADEILGILAYPHQGDSTVVLDSDVISMGEPQEMWTRGGGPAWLRINVTIQWEEQTSVSFLE